MKLLTTTKKSLSAISTVSASKIIDVVFTDQSRI